MQIILLYLACGTAAGFFSGLLGIGGGLVVVPLLSVVFSSQGLIDPELAMHLTIGTSLSSILFTSISSSRSHAGRGSVLWNYIRIMGPATAVGTLMGVLLASFLSSFGLKAFFTIFIFAVGTQMLLDFYPKASGVVPGKKILYPAGIAIGAVSSLVGLGGGSLSVPFMRWAGSDMRQAIGTSAALAWPIAIAGTIGYILIGWNMPGLPPYSLGYVNIPAMLGIACTSVFFAPLGVKLSHALPVNILHKIFAIFLYITAARMLWGMLH